MNNILLCTLGASWPVIPEVFGLLAPRHLDLYRKHPGVAELAALRRAHELRAPNELWICTTEGGQTAKSLANLDAWWDCLERPLPLRVWSAAGTDQLASQVECDHLRELILRVVLLASERAGADGQLVLSLAGGRKTMSADLQWAGSVFGAHAWLHVVGPDPLPAALTREATPERFAAPLPAECAGAVMPLVVGRGRRDELLDLELDGRRVTSGDYPLPLAEPRCRWSWPDKESSLQQEIERRQQQSRQLLGNYLHDLGDSERHENWRSLYRLPPRQIDRLRSTELTAEHHHWLLDLPKADLHRHLGGCLDIPAQVDVGRAIWADLSDDQRRDARTRVEPLLAQQPWPWDWPARLRRHGQRAHAAAALLVAADRAVLEENLFSATEPRVALKRNHPQGFAAYERPGELSGSALLTHPAAIEPYARLIVRHADEEGLAYVELRGSPQKYGDGLAFLQRFSKAIDAAVASLPNPQKPRFRFIIIADRRQRDRLKEVIEMAVQAKQALPDFVVGLDLAGDEGTACPEAIADYFLPAFEICLPITIHAGEGEAADSIWQAAYHLHADRIGHGLSLSRHPELAKRFRDRGICLELCPSSNREVVGFRDPAHAESAGCPVYPLWSLWQAGLPLTLCTDNPGLSRTSLAKEFLTAARMVAVDGNRLSCWDALAIIKQGFVHAFLPSEEKERLLKEVDARIYRQLVSGR